MDNNQKILIAAIIVILIILIGAFALSGSNNATPTVTPTATPVITATPTAVPSGGSSGASTTTPTPTVVVSATPTPVPSVSATPTPDSGVKQTQYGYWITYPPLGPENWSTNPPPQAGNNNNNIVYFAPTSQDITVPVDEETSVEDQIQGQAIVHRDGNLSGTTNVLISMGSSDNMYYDDSYEGYFFIQSGPGSLNPTLTDNNNGTYTLRFDPTVAEQTIYIQVDDIDHTPDVESVAADSSFQGWVSLYIESVNAPYTKGNDDEYSLNVNNPLTGTVTGTIYEPDGVTPYAYAYLGYILAGTSTEVYQAAGSDGTFTIDNFPDGHFSYAGYNPGHINIISTQQDALVTSGQTTNLDIVASHM